MKLYQAEWCPFSHRVRAKLSELGIDYELINVPASSKKRRDLEKVAGTTAIPVLVDGQKVISDSDEALSYLEKEYEAEPDELELHHRELSPTVYGTLPFGVEEATERLREALAEADIEVLQELDISSALGKQGAYKVLIAADPAFLRLAAEANPGAATLALLKFAVYEEDGSTRVDALEPEKGAAQIRNPQLNDRGLELRKRFINMIKRLERADTQGHESQKS
jgi:glutaredoxin 3